ncbi:MAG TPA: endolytic transglycosylase MltG [Dehalococcoidia bacterium]|nr:endolytic transglycosylase MltG [Dehalococcoidia bacterium]
MGSAAALVLMGLAAWQIYESPAAIAEPAAPPPSAATAQRGILVDIKEGEGVAEIAQRLEELGIVRSGLQLRTLIALLGYEGLLQAGTYEFRPGSSALEVAQRLRHGRFATIVLTVIEGWSLGQIAQKVEELGVAPALDFELAALAGPYRQRYSFLQDLPPGASLEGYLFPATYVFPRSITPEEMVQAMLDKMDREFTPELRQEARSKGLSVHEVLTLASIVEREVATPSERPIVAQVFLRRLRLGMPLEADPTVQYALAQDPDNVERYGFWKAPLTSQDLQVDSPYNTYRRRGLPPGPIASPGLDSILAVIRPADTNYLYFVAKGDGTHAFAETLAEHLRNVAQYQR